MGASTALRFFLAANFADELLGELFYLPYGRIWGSRWSYLHELLEGCYLPYGSLCIRVCGSFFACGECLGSSLPGFCNLCIVFDDSWWDAHFAHITEQRIFMEVHSVDAWWRGLALTFCSCLWVMNRKFQVLPDMVWLAVALAVPQRNIVELRSTLIRGASTRNDSMTTSRISIFAV